MWNRYIQLAAEPDLVYWHAVTEMTEVARPPEEHTAYLTCVCSGVGRNEVEYLDSTNIEIQECMSLEAEATWTAWEHAVCTTRATSSGQAATHLATEIVR